MKALLFALLLARGGDAVTTCSALSMGAREVAPLAPSHCLGSVAMQSGIAAGQILILSQVAKTHPKAAKVIGIVSVGIESGVVVHNVRVNVLLRSRR